MLGWRMAGKGESRANKSRLFFQKFSSEQRRSSRREKRIQCPVKMVGMREALVFFTDRGERRLKKAQEKRGGQGHW